VLVGMCVLQCVLQCFALQNVSCAGRNILHLCIYVFVCA